MFRCLVQKMGFHGQKIIKRTVASLETYYWNIEFPKIDTFIGTGFLIRQRIMIVHP